MKLLILQGLPASGKTTWAREFVSKNKDWVRVNRDDLRNMRGEYWIPKQEKLITDWEQHCVEAGFTRGMNVILDATNLNPKYKDRWKRIQEIYEVTIEYKKFDVDVEECIKRDLKRANSVGEDVIRGMYDKHLKPEGDKYVPDYSKPKAIIFDVDGTLAEMVDRSPYDWDKVSQDKVKPTVKILLDMYREDGFKIIIFTGRDGCCETKTLDWLYNNKIHFDEFKIREAGNTEKDSIIKRRMFDEIKDDYHVVSVFDDRDQVVRMWRELGLQCFQVEEGNF